MAEKPPVSATIEPLGSGQENVLNALRQSEARFRLAVRHSGIVFAQTDGDLRYVWVYNPHPDFDARAVIGRCDTEVADNDGTRRLMALKQRVLETGQRTREDLVFPVSDGQRFYDVIGEPIRDEGGRIVGVATCALDITERRAAEDHLKKYKNIVSSTADCISFLDKEYRYVIVNDACERFSGLTSDTFIGTTVSVYLGDAVFQQKIKPRFDRCLQGETVTYREWFDFPLKGRRFVEVNYHPYRDSDGRVAGVIANTRDITDHKRAEESLRLSEERLRLALAGSGVRFWEWYPEEPCFCCDELMAGIMGLPPGEKTVDLPAWVDRLDPDSRDSYERTMTEYLKGGSDRFELEYRIRNASGAWQWIWTAGECVEWNADNAPVRMLGTHTDITARKEAEEKIRSLNDTLERRIADRTVQLENRTGQLQRLALELTEAENLERRRIGTILHDDFQQQLAYIKMELCPIIEKNADRMVGQKLKFLEQLLGECIEQSRNLSYEISPPALRRNGLLTSLEGLAHDMKLKYGLQVTVQAQLDTEPDSDTLASLLYRAIKELLFNVVKHAGVGDARVEVWGEDDRISFRVADAGDGFTESVSGVRRGEGNGFGLSHIEDRITFVGGAMAVDTRPGNGCAVTLTVPRKVAGRPLRSLPPVADASHGRRGECAGSGDPAPADGPGPIRVLLADDHHLIREALARRLRGCKGVTLVGQATNGREVVDMAARLVPHVVLMDVTMPELDGFEATAHISRHHPDIRIIGLSMHNDSGTRERVLAAGASAYLTKTESPDVIVDTIRRVYRRRG